MPAQQGPSHLPLRATRKLTCAKNKYDAEQLVYYCAQWLDVNNSPIPSATSDNEIRPPHASAMTCAPHFVTCRMGVVATSDQIVVDVPPAPTSSSSRDDDMLPVPFIASQCACRPGCPNTAKRPTVEENSSPISDIGGTSPGAGRSLEDECTPSDRAAACMPEIRTPEDWLAESGERTSIGRKMRSRQVDLLDLDRCSHSDEEIQHD